MVDGASMKEMGVAGVDPVGACAADAAFGLVAAHAPRGEGRLHPDRSFDTIACGSGPCTDHLAALELGSRCAILSLEGARVFGEACASGAAFDARPTLALDAAGRVRVEPLRAWLAGGTQASGGDGRLRVVLNEMAGPYLCRPLQMGADAVMEDLRAWVPPAVLARAGLDAHMPCLAVACRTDRAWDALWRVLGLAAPDACHAMDAAGDDLLAAALATCSLRAQRTSDTALVAAHYLMADPRVAWVSYPGLPDDAANDAARRTLEHGFGPLVAFGVVGAADGPWGRDARRTPAADLLAFDCDRTVCAPGPQPGSAVVRAGLESPLDVVAALERFVGGLSNLSG